MPQQENRAENSVLFSLQELHKMEEQRVEQERAALRAREEAERRSREEAERRLREEEERRIREIEDAKRREEEARMAAEREERIRVEEAERRARIDAETRLREEQMRLDAHARQQSKSSLGLIAGVVAGVLILGGGAFYFYNAGVHEREEARMREAQKREQELDAKLREQEAKMSALIAEKQREIDSAKDEAQRIRLREEKQALQEKQSQLTTPRRRGSGDAKEERPVTSTPAFTGQKKKISDDPLDGL